MTINEQIKAWFENREDEFAAALAPLIAVDSTTGTPEPGAPFGAGPAKALKKALELAESWGLTTGEDEGYVGTVDLNDKADQLHILAHLDVVGIGDGWDTDPFTMVRDGDLIYGRGVDDDKGPLMAAMLAMAAAKELGGENLKYNAKLIMGTDEECGFGDLDYYYAREPHAPYAVSPDAEFPVINVEKGHYQPELSAHWEQETALPRLESFQGGVRTNVVPPEAAAAVLGLDAAAVLPLLPQAEADTGARFEAADIPGGVSIQAHGKNAHAASPADGVNAVTALLALLDRLPLAACASTRAVKALCRLLPHGDLGGKALGIAQGDDSGELTLTFSLLTMGAEGLSGRFDARTPVCASRENCQAPAERAFAEAGITLAGDQGPAHAVPADSPLIAVLLDSYTRYSGRPGRCVAIGGGTYVHDIPGGVAFGAGELDFDSHLHGANERARVDQLMMTAKIYTEVILRLCGGEAPV